MTRQSDTAPKMEMRRFSPYRDTTIVDWESVKLTSAVTLYSCALGAAAVLVSFLVRMNAPQHMTPIPSMFFSLAGALAALLITWPSIYWIASGNEGPRSLWQWSVIGLVYGLLMPFLTGALLPLSAVFVELTIGTIKLGQLWSQSWNAVFQAPAYSFIHGTIGIFTGLLAGALLGIGGWVIDRINSISNPIARRYCPWAMSLILGSIVVGFAVFGSPETLARLG